MRFVAGLWREIRGGNDGGDRIMRLDCWYGGVREVECRCCRRCTCVCVVQQRGISHCGEMSHR